MNRVVVNLTKVGRYFGHRDRHTAPNVRFQALALHFPLPIATISRVLRQMLPLLQGSAEPL